MYSLQSFYRQQIKIEPSPHSAFNEAIDDFLLNHTIPSPEKWQECLEECVWKESFLFEEKVFENWKWLLRFNFFRSFTPYSSASLTAKMRLFEHQPWNHHSPYIRVLVALNQALLEMPVLEALPSLLENGAALIHLSEYCPWMALPYTPYHLEMGLFLSLLGLRTKREELKKAASRIGHWQCQTFDCEGRPFQGLFVREKEGNHVHALCVTYLFFRTLSIFDPTPLFRGISQAAMEEIQTQKTPLFQEKISPLWALIEKWLDAYSFDEVKVPVSLPTSIYDPSMALVGYRSPSQHVVCTLHGGQTGLGVVRKKDVEIMSYGPQHLPLEDCRGFGIEGNAQSDHGIRQSVIESKPDAFSLKGCTRLVDQPSSSFLGNFRGIWLEVTQTFVPSRFDLETQFLGLEKWEKIAFSFFIKAEKCQIASNKFLLPGTLERYEGKSQNFIFEGKKEKLQLRLISSFQGQVQIIPLSGESHFWGANFLVAYLLDPEQSIYQWECHF